MQLVHDKVIEEPTILDLASIEPIISNIPPGAALVWRQGHSAAAEKFCLLAHRLHRVKAQKSIRTVLVTSAVPSEGKSTVALNLAAILAGNGSRTLLIDADLRAPDVHKVFGLHPLPGLGQVLTGEIKVERALRRVEPLGVYLLAAGDPIHNPISLLQGPPLANLLRRTREAFDWVIIDSPPLNPLADALCVGSVVDAILLVVRWGFTPKEQLEHALTSLQALPLLGMVMNAYDEPQDSYYYSYYSRLDVVPALPPPPTEIEAIKLTT